MPNTTPKHTKTTRFRAAAVLSVLFVVLALAAGVTYARYAMGKQGKGVLSSPEFYFSSDLLYDIPGTTYTLNQGSGGSTSFTFEVRNYVDALRINKNDIKVTVAVTSDNSAALEGVTVSQSTLTLADGDAVNVCEVSQTVTVSGLKNGETYKITATGDAGFKATLSATVTVKPDEPNIYMHLQDENDYYVLLTVWTKNLSGDVIITYPEGLIPDATDPAMATGVDFGTRTFTDAANNFMNAYSSHVYRFFKNKPGNNFDIAAFENKVVLDPSDPADASVKAISAIPE